MTYLDYDSQETKTWAFGLFKLQREGERMEVGSRREKEKNKHKSEKPKPPFVIAKDDTKPVLQDPLWSSDPTQAEEAVLRLPPFPFTLRSNAQSK